MTGKRVLVCIPQVPFIRGGAELLVDRLAQGLRHEDFAVDTVAVPFQEWPQEALIQSACMWRLLDLHKLNAPADFVIATKFPSYYVLHPQKILWLFHTYRQVYDLYDTAYSGYSRKRVDDVQLIRWVVEHDKEYLQECRKILAISQNVRNRLRRFLDLDAEVLYPPPPLDEQFYCADYEPFILAVQRLDHHKRTELLLKSLQFLEGDYQLWIVGTGPEEQKLRQFTKEKGLQEKVRFLGHVSDQELLEYYARCRLVYYAPYDEDYGFTTLEAFLSRKPVVTADDSGGTLEFVEHSVNGWIVSPQPQEIAMGLQTIMDQPQLAQSLGEAGYRKVQNLKWKNVIARFKEVFAELLP